MKIYTCSLVVSLMAAALCAQELAVPCREDCARKARAAQRDCLASDAAREECAELAEGIYAECEGACPEPPPPCGMDCREAAREAAAACRDNRECVSDVIDKLHLCLGDAGCDVPDIRPDIRPDDRPAPCGADCRQTAREAAAACGDDRKCVSEVIAKFHACLEEAGCDRPDDRPPRCGDDCRAEARRLAAQCDSRDCLNRVRRNLAACLDEADCDRPDDRPPPCGIRCREAARVDAEACAGDRDCLKGVLDAFYACLDGAGCDAVDGRTGDRLDGDADGDEVVVAELLAHVPMFLRGDANGDDQVNLADPTMILSHLFSGGAGPACADAADANDDGRLDVSDPVVMLNRLFAAGAVLPEPSSLPGPDPTPDDLGCDRLAI